MNKWTRKAIKRWWNTSWTNGTYVKLCAITAVTSAGIIAVSEISQLIDDRNYYKKLAEERLELNHELAFSERIKHEEVEKDEEA